MNASPMTLLASFAGLKVYHAGRGFEKPGIHLWIPLPVGTHIRILPLKPWMDPFAIWATILHIVCWGRFLHELDRHDFVLMANTPGEVRCVRVRPSQRTVVNRSIEEWAGRRAKRRGRR